METAIILDSVNPSGVLRAIVEQTEKTIYLYIQPHPDFAEQYPMRSCWVRNLVVAPEEFDREAMDNGDAPLLPAAYCGHPYGAETLDPDELSLVWLSSEDGASLFYKEEIIAIIPGWSLYMDQPVSYAQGCIAETPDLFPLQAGNILIEQSYASLEFLNQWDENSSNTVLLS